MGNHHLWQSESVPDWIRALRRAVRTEVAALAKQYALGYTSEPTICPSMVWLVGGHQPEAFHPGVWYKNFLMDAAAKALSKSGLAAVGLHLIIDHDLPKSLSIKTPYRLDSDSGLVALGHSGLVAVGPCLMPIRSCRAVGHPPEPWHRYRIDTERIEEFVLDIEASARSIGLSVPLAREFFEPIRKQEPDRDAAIALSQARHLLEIQQGLGNVDLPMSLICQTKTWFDFVEYCLQNAERLFEIYNQALEVYRAREKITNPGQPVAHLVRGSDWIELPFWLYRASDPLRNRLWFRRGTLTWEIGSGSRIDQLAWTMPFDPQKGGLLAAIEQRSADAICLRPRALMTTLFLRCFLADGFVHGIGGGIYDRLTDDIIRGLFGIDPPGYTIATATLHLPVQDALRRSAAGAQSELEQLKRVSRTLRSAPQYCLVASDPVQQSLAREHSELLSAMPERGRKKSWHKQMVELKGRIRKAIDPYVQEHQSHLQAAHRRAQEAQLLTSREYSILLFPKRNCVDRLKALASQVRA